LGLLKKGEEPTKQQRGYFFTYNNIFNVRAKKDARKTTREQGVFKGRFFYLFFYCCSTYGVLEGDRHVAAEFDVFFNGLIDPNGRKVQARGPGLDDQQDFVPTLAISEGPGESARRGFVSVRDTGEKWC
jgi:hypothetical protein